MPLVADLNVTIPMRVTIIDGMEGMNKNPVILSKKAPPQAAKFCYVLFDTVIHKRLLATSKSEIQISKFETNPKFK